MNVIYARLCQWLVFVGGAINTLFHQALFAGCFCLLKLKEDSASVEYFILLMKA